MLGIMLQKMWQKRWMNLSLLLGCILLIATTVSFPLYQKAAYDRMLQDEFTQYVTQEGRWPMVVQMGATCKKDKKDTIGKIEKFADAMYAQMGVPKAQTVEYLNVFKAPVISSIKRADAEDMTLSLCTMTDLENHASIINGSMYSESGRTKDGAIEVVISQATLISKGLLLDEELTFDTIKDADGNKLKVKIVGVFAKEDSKDFYFQENPENFVENCFMNTALFKEMFTGENASKYTIGVTVYDLIDYEKVTANNISKINEYTEYMCTKSAYKSVIKDPKYQSILEEYELKKVRISTTLIILQVPVLVLLAAFLLMISGQMYEMERNEISVIKSRGSFRGQILLLYIYQGLFLTFLGAAFGIPLGGVFSRLLGSTRNFLEFDFSQGLKITYTLETFVYALAAMFITLLSISLPAVKHSKVSIVHLKQQKALKKKSFWEKFYLDIVLIGVSGYGFYSFNKSMGSISETVLSGKSLDPLLYISSSLFIVGMGLFFLRIQPNIVKLIYLCVKRFCGPSSYISFMENIKNGRKMQLIMLFLIMTISLGMFHATVARTILENAVENTEYRDGVDIIIKENWPGVIDSSGVPTGQYMEPDFGKYASMDFASTYSKVYYDNAAYVKQSKNSRTMMTLMGIHTKEFGLMTKLPEEVNDKYYYEYLNELAKVEDGALLSKNFQTTLDYKIGDTIEFTNVDGDSAKAKIVGFVDYFPTYSPTVTTINPDGNAVTEDNYLIVTHYAFLKKQWGVKPYEIWISLNDNADSNAVAAFIDKYSMKVKRYVNKSEDVENTMTDPLLQGTNGVLTMGFVVTILLCAVGYLIYWIMSIKERELVFGVLRACGFHKSEIVKMLVIEQIFSGVFSVLAGIGIGKLTSGMFVPMLQASYATSEQVLPMKLITRASDMYRLYGIIAAVMLVSVFVLIALLFRMNVTKALKLGEE